MNNIKYIPYRGRLAPSPTGFLHMGHGKTFYTAWKRAREAHGEIYLRIEDLCPQRSKAEYVEACIEDLNWMGLDWDGEIIYQSQRHDLYLGAWQKLKEAGHLYPCNKSRKDLRNAASAPHEEDQEALFPIEWRASSTEAESYTNPEGAHWRFRVPEGKRISFYDKQQGPQNFIAGKDFGDFVVWRNDNVAAYELAVVVDDSDMKITEVVRGEDLLLSTARQILIYEALGSLTPTFCHLPLVYDKAGRRLAKRHRALAMKTIRDQGSLFPQSLNDLTGLIGSE